MFLLLLPWWLDLKAKWYEWTWKQTYNRNWQDPKSCEALLEWLGMANHKWILSWLGPHAHLSHQWCTQKLNLGHAKLHSSKLEHNLCCHRVWRTFLIWWRCSSNLWLKIKMSSKYITMNALVKGHKMLSINIMKVARAFVNPESMTNHSKSPSLDLNVVFHILEGSKGT